MIHEVKGRFVISSCQSWMPGCYETRKAAQYAFQFSDRELQKMQDVANKRNGGYDGIITTYDLKLYRKNNPIKIL